MTIIALLFGLSAILLYARSEYFRNRAANLDIIVDGQRLVIDGYKAQNEEMACLLDDATRLSERLHVSNGHLIRETETMGLDLLRIEQLLSYYRAHYTKRKGAAAGFIIMQGLGNPARKMEIWKSAP